LILVILGGLVVVAALAVLLAYLLTRQPGRPGR
jgi:hypothetical protein